MKRALCLLLLLLWLPSGASARRDISLEIEPLFQEDYPTVLFTYKGVEKSVLSSGCGAVCLSMAMQYLDPKVEQTPETLLTWAYENEYYKGNGLGCNALVKMLEGHGFSGEWIGPYPNRMLRELRNGHPLIACMGPGYFTDHEHYILIRGIDAKDMVQVVDPANRRYTEIEYSLKMIFSEIQSGHALLICSPGQSPLPSK